VGVIDTVTSFLVRPSRGFENRIGIMESNTSTLGYLLDTKNQWMTHFAICSYLFLGVVVISVDYLAVIATGFVTTVASIWYSSVNKPNQLTRP